MTAPAPVIVPPSPEPRQVAVVVLTFDGRSHLAAGLPSMLALEGLAGPASIVVADNGSRDGTRDWLKAEHPGVTLVELGANHGFAEGYDRALDLVDAPWALLLNNDTHPAADVLRTLCDAVRDGARHEGRPTDGGPIAGGLTEGGPVAAGSPDAAHQAGGSPDAGSPDAARRTPGSRGAGSGPVVCAGARLVDWEGRRIDFDGGGMAITGHGHALGHGRRLWEARALDPRPTLFCSGAAMLVHVPTFRALGGFDPSYFAYYEDVDFGWRLWAAGCRALHVPAAVVRHRGGGSAGTLGGGRRARLHERNALATIVKNAAGDLAPAWIRASLGLAAWRATSGEAGLAVIDEAAMAEGGDGDLLPDAAWSGWRALAPLHLDLDAWRAARERTQARQRRPVAEIIPLMHYPWTPVPPTVAGWAALRRADRTFGLGARFGAFGAGARRGPAARAGELAEALLWRVNPPKRRAANPPPSDDPARPAHPPVATPAVDLEREPHTTPAVFGDPVDIVLVSYEGRELLAECLPALAAQDYPAARLIVADNGSRDGTVEWLRGAWPDVEIIDLGRNLGFAEANNRAIAAGAAPWVALVNSDTLPEAGWLSALVRAADGRPEVAAVASRMLFMDRPDTVQSAGIALDPSGIAWDRLGGAPAAAAAGPATVFGASAGAALFRRAALEDVAEDGAVFESAFFMYLEDVDLAWRLRLRGWTAAYAPEATILHAGSATSGEGSAFKNRLLARNKIWTIVRCYPASGLLRYGPIVLAYDLASIPYRLLVAGQGAALRGRVDALSGLRRAVAQRRSIQAGRIVGWRVLRAAMAPLDTPLGVVRRYRHLRPSAGVVDRR